MASMKKCPVCDKLIKLENLDKHLKNVHPREKVETTYSKKEERALKAHADRQKELSKPTGMWKWTAAVVAFIVVAVIALTVFYPSGPGGSGILPVGSELKDFTLTDTNGSPVTLSDLTGQIIFLDFFDADCGVCKKNIENYLPQLYQSYGSSIKMVSIDVGFIGDRETMQDVLNFKNQYSAQWTFLLDEWPQGAERGTAATLYGVDSTPTEFLIGPDGKVAYNHNGGFDAQSYSELTGIINGLLTGG